MSGETTQQELVWMSPEEYESSVGGQEDIQLEDANHTKLPRLGLPAILIENGIQLKHKGEALPFTFFTYCPGPMIDNPIRVDWKILSQKAIVGHHIHCYQLEPRQNLPLIINQCNIEYTRALILITPDESFLLSRDFQWEGMIAPPFPVCVINQEQGQKLLEIICQNEIGDVMARVISSSVTQEEAMRGKSPSPEKLSLTLEQAKGKQRRVPQLLHYPKHYLEKKLIEIMTSPTTGPFCVSENRDLFQQVMEEFYNYECAAKTKPHSSSANRRVFQKLIKFIDQDGVFKKDAPFYVLLVYRVFRYQQVYLCEEHNQFIHKCIMKFEEMIANKILVPVMKFIDNGDFLIQYNDDSADTSVFHLLDRACIVLMKESVKMKSRVHQGAPPHQSLFCKMMWLTVSLKFKSVCGAQDGTKTWYDHLTKEPGNHYLDNQSVEEFVSALNLGQELKLPVEAVFGIEEMSSLLASGEIVRPFCQLSNFLKKVEPNLHVAEDFLKHIIVRLREPYRVCLEPATKKLEHISTYGNLLGAIQEGLTFLDTVHDVWLAKNWQHPSFDAEMLKWVLLLLGAVDVTTDKTPSYLKEFISQVNHFVCSQYHKEITQQVIAEVKKNFNHLSILKFSRLFKSFYIWPLEVAKEYLFNFGQKIPARANVNDKLIVEFITEIVERFAGAENHNFIFEFFTYMGEHYLGERRPKEFVFHLLSMNIPGLFAIEPSRNKHIAQSVPVCFKIMLRDYIQRNRLTNSVVGHVTAIWKSISEMSEFQLLVLSVLEKELIPESRNLQAPIKDSIKPILDDTISLLSYDASWLEEVTAHHKFAFGVVSVCCNLIPVAKRLDWTLSYNQVVEKLGSIYSCYCKAKGLAGEDCWLRTVPDDILACSCDDILTYFKWIVDIQQILADWKREFSEKTLNYDSIQHYNHIYSNLDNIGAALCAPFLVADPEVAEGGHSEYLKLFERLNCHLIKYISGHPEASWLLLPSLLTEYGIEIPEKIAVPLSQQVVFPGEKTDGYLAVTFSEMSPSFTGAFCPGHDVSLKIASTVTLCQLFKLVHDLDELLSPIQENLDLLIYFFLHKSAIFDTYLQYQLRKHSGQSQESPPSMQAAVSCVHTMSGSFLNSSCELFKGLSMNILAKALEETKELVVKLVEGTAQYCDVTAGGNLLLEKMDIVVEFKVLVDYAQYLNHISDVTLCQLFNLLNDLYELLSPIQENLLSMNIPALFAIESSKNNHAAQVPLYLKTMLREYIQRKRIANSVIDYFTAKWKSISEMSEFQLLVLSILEKELISEPCIQTPIKDSIKPILDETINLLSYDASWLEELNPHQKFAFHFVSMCCSSIPLTKRLDWMLSYSQVVEKLGSIFLSYCKDNDLTNEDCWLQAIPDDVIACSCEDMEVYFQWIVDVQKILADWKREFSEKTLNYDRGALCTPFLVADPDVAEGGHSEYLKLFERLNCHLIKYISGQPEASWLFLPNLLMEYGIEIPEKIAVPLLQQLVFPVENIEGYSTVTVSDIPSSLTGVFCPNHDVSLKLASNVTLCQLSKLVDYLDDLLSPIQENLDLFIYFFLHKSAIFHTYFQYQLRKHNGQIEEYPLSIQATVSRVRIMSCVFLDNMGRNSEPFKGISWKCLAEALKETKGLLFKLVEGTAQCSDVTAGGNLPLEKMDLDIEFKVLADYIEYLHSGNKNYTGLHDIQCMLELFQCILNVYSVCEQYHMKGCLQDARLQEIKAIADDLQQVTCHDQLTPKEAIEKVEKILPALFLKKQVLSYNCQCMKLFSAVADSAIFYQFIKDKQFYGDAGQEVFLQQYEFITAQLQHEDYNEVVLNHLLIAFKVISPFLDDEQDFESLMSQVNELSITTGCQELQTVNKNIHLVRLWFSRAEKDTLEMVPAELEAILGSGEYQFIFGNTSDGVKAQLFLKYQPPSVLQAITPIRPSQPQTDVLPDERLTSHRDSFDNPSRAAHFPGVHRDSTSSPPPPLRIQRWNSDQIRDFEQRIGFLDPEQDLSLNINKFLMFNQNAYKLLELYQRLRDLGHPFYTELEPQRKLTKQDQPKEAAVPFRVLPCSLSENDVKQKVEEAEEELKIWSLDVADLHKQYETLLFFSIPKLRHVHKKLVDGHMDNIVAEISFLFKNNIIVREKLKATVKLILPQIKVQVESCSAPMIVVGSFLHQLFVDHDLSRFALQPRHPYRQLQRTLSSRSSTVLHSCHGLSRVQLMSLLINCYNGVPGSFQLIRCKPSTSEDELMLFLNRAVQYSFQYMVVGVELLSYQLQELLLQFQFNVRPAVLTNGGEGATLHFIETGPTILREIPLIMVKDHKDGLALNYERAKKICRQGLMAFEDFQCITLVYGHAGDGKSHLIKSRLRNQLSHMVLHIPINEAFTPLSAIKKLQNLPMDTRGCCIYFNFTVLPPSSAKSHQKEKKLYDKLMEVVNWFFFDLLILGYVEDPTSGESFRLPGGLSLGIFIEVPSGGFDMSPSESLTIFLENVPALGLVANKEYVEPRRPYVVDNDVELICKYLKAYEIGCKKGIDKLYKGGFRKGKETPMIKFSKGPVLEVEECHYLLDKYTPAHMKCNKTTQKLFVNYMKRCCYFLDNLPDYKYNTGGSQKIPNIEGKKVANNAYQLGFTLMSGFLKEVERFCNPDFQADWSKNLHLQLIYGTVDGQTSISLTSPSETLPKARVIGIPSQSHSLMEMHSREQLDDYLSRALTVPLDDNGRLRIIDESTYVLTLDYTLKMLNIHERCECGMPIIVEGETGVGKTALIEVLSKLWNYAHLTVWHKTCDNILKFMQRKINDILEQSPSHEAACLEVISNLSLGEGFTEVDLQMITELPDSCSPSVQFHSIILKKILKLKDDPVLALLEQPETESKKSFNFLFRAAEYHDNAKTTAELLYAVLTAKVKNTFHKLNVHAALKPSDVMAFFKDISDQAYKILHAYNKCEDASSKMKVPSVTVFLDDINTASCLGLFKEIIVDKTIDGTALPPNVFIIGACNSHRGDSLAALAADESWIRSNYYVRVLHPTLNMLKWDYGSLDEYQERDYINAKLCLMHQEMQNVELANLAELIVCSQNMMRAFAYKQLRSLGVDEINAVKCSKSSVSQRDIQRVFTFYEWLMKVYVKCQPYGASEDYHQVAIMVSLALVYYLRLDDNYRAHYIEAMHKSAHLTGGLPFTDILQREVDWYISEMDIPPGIAKTEALKENIFSIIVCTMTHTPLIIVGPPGCSKTLSFNLVTANLRGQESKMKLFRDTEIFYSLDLHFYQCTRHTTPNEIQTVFSRSINRQHTYTRAALPICCVVLIDIICPSSENLQSLNFLHYYLDRREVSFVAISNHMLDAAKTNRAVSLFRSEPSLNELRTLAKGCLCDTPDDPPPEIKKDVELIVKFCLLYHKFMEHSDFRRFFGLRDFIHFINYLKRQRGVKGITERLVMQALERNFNGHKLFDTICKEFLSVMDPTNQRRHSILEVLHDSLKDQPQLHSGENEVRYKLIIDSSEDNSLLHLLFAFGILKERDTRTYVCSDFPGDSHQQMINTIAAICHSAAAGHTVIMSQTDELLESFYDLFNQQFHRIDDPKTGPRFYANVAIGAHHKPCHIHPAFQCIVVVKQSQIDDIPHAFLNRFEKYSLTHRTLLDAVLNKQPAYLKSVIQRAYEKASEFIEHVGGPANLYGLHDDTLDSLVLSLLPPVGFQDFIKIDKPEKPETIPQGIHPDVFLLKKLLQALRKRSGFRLPRFTHEELAGDAEYIMELVSRDSQFAGQLSALTHEDVLQAVPEALQGLYHTNKGSRTDLSINACMVISVFLQWLIRHLCKRLMQLMTTEALTTVYQSLPHSYTETYLKHQSHFNLQALVERQLQVMELDDRIDRSTTGTANRLLLFTRSSALIHQLPASYPVTGSSSQLSCDYDDLIRNLVYYYTEDVCVCKLSSITSQANMAEVLNSFWLSKKQRIILLVANMKETSREMISHLRLMIEENDTGEKLKLFVLLLHFPPSMFTTPCYLTLFSNTWDHHYLDIIGQNTTGQVMDICEWLSLWCSYLSPQHSPQQQISMHLSTLLLESIPTISSRVFFGKVEGASFNCYMDVPRRNKALQQLFETGVGEILCEKFLKYWEPRVMLEYLEKAAMLTTKVQTNALSITDSLQTILRDTFFDYIVYMIAKMNEDMNIDILMDPNCSQVTRDLFFSLLHVYPMPKLSQLKALSSFEHSISSLESSQHAPYIPGFPFYRMVSIAMEKIIDQARKEINQHLDTLREFPDPVLSISQMSITSLPKVIEDKGYLVVSMQQAIERTIKQILESTQQTPLKVALQAMIDNPDLMKKYSEAFIHQKLRLGASSAGISFCILRLTFTQLHPNKELLTCLILLHVCMHIYQLDLSRLVQVLHYLDTYLDMAAVVSDDPFAEAHPSPAASFLSAVQESGDLLGQPGDLGKYVLRILFSALAGSVLDQNPEDSVTQENIFLWCVVYRDVMSMSAVKDYLYKNLTQISETQHNIMQAAFLVVQSSYGYNEVEALSTARKVFSILFSIYLSENMEMKQEFSPRLQNVVSIIVQELVGSSVDVALQHHNTQLRHILEGLFSHYFSIHRPTPNAQDCQCFLELVNKNTHWNVDYLFVQVRVLRVSETLETESPRPQVSSPDEEHESRGCIPMSVYKYYLTLLLDKADVSNIGMTSLALYKPWVRDLVGKVLVTGQHSTTAGPYIPTFYQECTGVKCPATVKNKLMQQPLAHLYFVTVLHHLMSHDFNLTSLVRVANAISENLEEAATLLQDKVLHNIERQAVVQAVIQQLAKSLNPSDPSSISAIATIIADINYLLDNESMGGGDAGGHGLALSLHLLKDLHSFKKFTKLLGPNSFCKDFNCLVRLSTAIELPEEEYLFPFLVYVGKGNLLRDLYERVGRAMHTVHTSRGRKTTPLTSLAQEWSQGQVTISLPDGHEVHGERSSIFRMVLWLNVYYKFYCQKKSSPVLVDMLKDQLLYAVQPAPLNKLISCFLDPSKMIREASLDSNSPTYDDPIFTLFNPESKDDDPSDAALRHALANMIAVVVVAPPTSTHLWFHMFAADQLAHTHMAGFMLETPVGQDDIYYDTGVQLTDNGFYGQQSYLKHATRGTLSLQSLYLLLWANAGAFCVGLLTDTESESKMCGSVFPEYFSVRQFCMKQLKTLWGHLSTSLGISVEERSFLVSRTMWNLLKFACGKSKMLAGKFSTIASLNNYETTWYNSIFMPVWNILKKEYATYANLYNHDIFRNIKTLEACYPCFTTESALLQALLSNTNIGDCIASSEHLLAQLALFRHQLELGGLLLTDLVELYQWFHQELAYVITRSDAETIYISRAVQVLAKSYSPEEGERLHNLYKRVRDSYNQYRELTGLNVSPLEDTTPLLHVLSCSTDSDGSPDLLYNIISDIVTTHNNFLMKAESVIRSDPDSPLARYLPKELPRVHPTEFTAQNCIIEQSQSLHGMTVFNLLINSRSALPSPLYDVTGCHTSLPCWLPSLINLQLLQEDIFSAHVAGKPLIGPPQSLRTHFAFRDAHHHAKDNLSAIEADLETISSKLLDEFKCPMNEHTIKLLEQHFHSAAYHTIMEVLCGLRGVAGHLIKNLMGISQSELIDLNAITIAEFLSSVFETHEHLKSVTGSKNSVLHEIGISSLTPNQFIALENISLTHLHDALRWFVTWVSQGWYEFCSLPYSMKIRLSAPDMEALYALPDHYTEPHSQLLRELKALVMVLSHFESTSTITSMALKDSQLSIVEFLSRLGECTEQEDLMQLVPETILIENYVAFRVVLKQLISRLQKQLSSGSLSLHPHKKCWEDFVDDLWKNNLSHFRNGNYSYAVVSTADQRRRDYSLRNIDQNDEDLLNDLMTAGVSESELLPDTDNEESSSQSPSLSSRFSHPVGPHPLPNVDVEDVENSFATSFSSPKREARTKKLAESFTCKQVCEFLQSIDLQEYVPQFEDYDIRGDILLTAGQGKGLEDLGVVNPLHRLKICVLFRRQLEGMSKIAKRYPVEEVVRFLHSMKMSEHVEKFEEHKIDGELLLAASDDALEVLGVVKQIQRIAISTHFKNYISPRFTTL